MKWIITDNVKRDDHDEQIGEACDERGQVAHNSCAFATGVKVSHNEVLNNDLRAEHGKNRMGRTLGGGGIGIWRNNSWRCNVVVVVLRW